VVLPVVINIGNSTFMDSEVLKFGVKAKGTQFQMQYKYGPDNLGGVFLLAGVQGQDDKAGTGDAWKVGFYLLPPNMQKFDNVTTATVGIGTDFTGSITVTNGNGSIGTGEKQPKGVPEIVKIGVSSKGTGSIATSVLPTSSTLLNTATGLPTAASDSGKSTRFAFLITLNAANGNEMFGGEGAANVYSNGKSWAKSSK
jgi:hypothetical protein